MDRLRLSDLIPRSTMKRHSHAHPYAAVVISGGYEEAGDSGRHRVVAGHVLVHPSFSSHCDRVPNGRNRVLDIPLRFGAHGLASFGRVDDVDEIVRAADSDPASAVHALLSQFTPMESASYDLPDQLAAALNSDSPPNIGNWARQHDIARETLSRQFLSLYEVSPARYRVEARARRAWHMIRSQPHLSLADIAAASGFADQPHLTRDIAMLTGRTPGHWQSLAQRASHLFKTDAG